MVAFLDYGVLKQAKQQLTLNASHQFVAVTLATLEIKRLTQPIKLWVMILSFLSLTLEQSIPQQAMHSPS